MKTDLDGNITWVELFGGDDYDMINGITINRGQIFIAGESSSSRLFGVRNKGDNDVFIASYNREGKYLWGKTVGTSKNDRAYGIVNSLGNIYITGVTGGVLANQVNNGRNDAFVMKYNFDGEPIFTKLIGTFENDKGKNICVGVNFIYIIGETEGKFPGFKNYGDYDVFVKMISM